MTNEEVQAYATIFAICWKATNARSANDISNAQRRPIAWATMMINRLYADRKSTPEIELALTEQYCKISPYTIKADFDKILPLEQQGVWALAFRKAMAADK